MFFDAVYKKGTQGGKHQAKFVQYKNSESVADRSKTRGQVSQCTNRCMRKLASRSFAIRCPLYEFSLGRSMVEMLGVLALIAVLTVGGMEFSSI